ncbi:zinc-dependent metalloprotease [Arthrobacter sp. MMS24-S77]
MRNTRLFLQFLSRDFGVGLPQEDGHDQAIEDSFAASTVFSASVLQADEIPGVVPGFAEAHAGVVFADMTPWVLSDINNHASALAVGGSPFKLVPGVGFTLYEGCAANQRSTELSASLTFSTENASASPSAVVAADPRRVTIVQRISLLELPTGFTPREYHPASGAYGKAFHDFAAVGTGRTARWLQPRFRLETDEEPDTDGLSGVQRPIVFHVDRAIPEPYRTAVLEGANWWSAGFTAAGFRDAYLAELLPPGNDPWTVPTNMVWWVHRSGPGWSLGNAQTDPFTGEILRGNVRLGSQRIPQLRSLFEALLSPYGKANEEQLLAEIEAAVLQRIRHLAAHEIGHALGFMHNFASTNHPAPSVMDYPHPAVSIRKEGQLSLSHAYSDGLGPWDHFLVKHAYGNPAPGESEASFLGKLREESEPLAYLSDEDGSSQWAASPEAIPWTVHTDVAASQGITTPAGGKVAGRDNGLFAALEHALRVRQIALEGFGPGAIPPDAQLGELANRLNRVYFFHRFQASAVLRLLGGGRYRYGTASDSPKVSGIEPVAGSIQRLALRTAAGLLSSDVLDLPKNVSGVLSAQSIRHATPARESRLGPLHDEDAAAAAAVTLVAQEAMEPSRLNRMASQHIEDPEVPLSNEVLHTLFHAAGNAGRHAVVARHTVIRAAVHALGSGRLTDENRVNFLASLEQIAESTPSTHSAFIRHGINLALTGGLSGDLLFRQANIPQGTPL